MTKPAIRIAMLLAATLAAGCFSEHVTEPEETTACTSSGTNACVVTMRDNTFTPATIRVSVGSAVTWQNEGSSPHTSTSGSWDSGTVSPGGEFERAFPDAGSFDYQCVFHAGMQGTVVVE